MKPKPLPAPQKYIAGVQKIDKASMVNIDPANFFLDGMMGKPIGHVVSCVENDEGLTVTVERDIQTYSTPVENVFKTLKKIIKVIDSKATDKKKVEKIQKILL